MAGIFWSGAAATAVSLWMMVIGEDASFLPHWMVVSLFPALHVGFFPFVILGPAIALCLGSKRAYGWRFL